jgi:hypothetical protein
VRSKGGRHSNSNLTVTPPEPTAAARPAGSSIDVYEHAFYVDYQNKKADYVEKFLKFVDWAEAEKRYRSVVKG